MFLKEFFSRLSYAELSNLSIGNEGSGKILESSHNKIIHYTNEGLLRIFSRFILKEKDLLIEQVDGVTNYHLRKKFAETAETDTATPYIKDLPDEPFTEDVIKVLAVYDRTGKSLPLNDQELENSLFTPQPFTIQVPFPVGGQSMTVLYQANHAIIYGDYTEYLAQEIDLPYFLEGALQSFVAYKVYSHMNGIENSQKSQEHYSVYESICAEVEERDLANTTFVTTHNKLGIRGFV